MSTIHTWANTILIAVLVIAWALVGGYQPVAEKEGLGGGTSDSWSVGGNLSVTGDGTVSGGDFTVTTSNSATSSIEAGCIQTYATSTASPIKVTWGKVGSTATTTLYGGTSVFLPYGEYGTCP